jgi:cytochrome c-type biogenesis protein CcmF
MTWAMATWLACGTFFCFLLAGPAHPFLPAPSPVPADGPGPNPLLQNHVLMIVHPPMLYLGYVGMAIPFGYAVGALAAGRLGAAQLQPMRRWLLVPWGFLTVGIVLGGWWAYEVLGWGGYWAWDPVENASLLPWLTATAALHAAMLPQRRGSMKAWTVTLVLATFLLTVLGTFMTRSGVFNSVHSFSQSDIGPTILGFLALSLVVSVLLLAARVDRLEGEGEPPAPVSRETAFLVNNLLFATLTFTVLLGTVFPLVVEAVKGTKLSVGEPYFNKMAVPIGVAILFLMGIGPALPWGRPSLARVGETLRVPALAGIVTAVVGALLGATTPWPLATLFCAGLAGAVTTRELRAAFVARNHRRAGGYVIHAGVIVMLVAVAVSSAYRIDREVILEKGTCTDFGGHQLCYVGTRDVQEPHRTLQIADVRVDGRADLAPALAIYPRMGNPIGSPAVQSSPTHDLYVSLMNLQEGGSTAGFHLFRNPLVPWIWVGAAICALGTLLSLWPGRPRGAEAA